MLVGISCFIPPGCQQCSGCQMTSGQWLSHPEGRLNFSTRCVNYAGDLAMLEAPGHGEQQRSGQSHHPLPLQTQGSHGLPLL